MKKVSLILCLIFSLFSMSLISLERVPQIVILSGSNREGSFNKKLALLAVDLLKEKGIVAQYIDLNLYPLPHYDGDLEMKGQPESAKKLQKIFQNADAVIIATPEYNSSIPGVLKDTIDWLSRSDQGEPTTIAFKDKAALLLSASPGKGGGKRALVHLRAILEDVHMKVFLETFSLGSAYSAFETQGNLKDYHQENHLKNILNHFLSSLRDEKS